jgi:YggT family protein
MSLALAITRADVANYVDALFLVYIIIIFARILLSWIPRMPYNRALNATTSFITEVTDPYLGVFRRIIPPIGGLDISPILAIFVLVFAQALIVGAIRG